jgi:hypothetical protein
MPNSAELGALMLLVGIFLAISVIVYGLHDLIFG